MRIRTAVPALLAIVVLAASSRAATLDLKRYMPLSELRPGMTGIGKTTLRGADIIEFQVTVQAILKNAGPKRDLIIVRCSGAGLEESGVVAGMSGSPIYIDGRLIGALAYAYFWCKVPLAGIQPIEYMLPVTDEHPWSRRDEAGAAAVPGGGAAVACEGPAAVRVPASAVGSADLLAAGVPGEFDMTPIQVPLMVSGLAPRALERLRRDLAPFGIEAMQSGAVERPLPALAKLEPGAPLAIPLVRGDIMMTGMGTITEIVGDRLYGFGHAMFGAGEADLPLMTGIGYVVVPSLQRSSRMGAPVDEVGRLTWDEETAVFGRLTKDRAHMVPVVVTVRGPDKGAERTYRCETIRHRRISATLAGTVVLNSLLVQSDLPRDYTLAYRLSVKPAGRDPIVYDNVCAGPDGDGQVVAEVRNVVGLLMENPFQNLAVESVEAQIQVEPESRMAEIEGVRALKHAVRPGGTVPVEVKVRPWRQGPKWIRIGIDVPRDYPDGTYRAVVCGADEAQRQQMRETPARFHPQSLDGLVRLLRMDDRRDRLYVRLADRGQGIAVGEAELPNLPESMRALLAEAVRQNVSDVRASRVVTHPMPYVLTGEAALDVAVDEHAVE
jgi:hypothetical protein